MGHFISHLPNACANRHRLVSVVYFVMPLVSGNGQSVLHKKIRNPGIPGSIPDTDHEVMPFTSCRRLELTTIFHWSCSLIDNRDFMPPSVTVVCQP